MKFILEKDIPVPTGKSPLKIEIEDTMADMAVGLSFFIIFNDKRPAKACRWCFENVKKKLKPKKFTAHKEKDKSGILGLRIWRLPDAVKEPKPA